jgi:hypothetical protein
VGFVLTYPQHPSTPAARSAIDFSVLIFDTFGKSFSVATSAAKIMRDLCPKVDFLGEQSRARQALSETMSPADFGDLDEGHLTHNKYSMADVDSSMDYDSGFYDTDGSNPDLLFDMALDVDFWADFDMLWPNADPLPGYYGVPFGPRGPLAKIE